MTRILPFLLLAATAWAASDTRPDTRLVEAAKADDKAAAIALLAQHVDVNAPEADGTTAIAWAVRASDADLVGRLIQAKADVKAANRYGVTPLYLACVNGDASIIAKLLDAGADANSATTEGETALMTVAHTGNVEAAKVLLSHGAVVDTRDTWHGQTALMWAAGQSHAEMIQTLLQAGADVNARSSLVKWERQTTSEPREKWLPPGGMSALLFAARQGCVECERVLIGAGAELNAPDPDGITPLLSALINGHYDAAAFLLDNGADPNLADKTGRAPLFTAVDFHTMPQSNRPSPRELDNRLSSLDLVKALLAHGASVDAQLKTQQPYRVKLDRGDDTMLTTGTTPLLRAAKAGDAEVMRLLLAKGADAKLATRNGINPLMAAAGAGTKEEDTVGRHKTEAEAIESIQLCLDAGVDINATETRGGQTALHAAAEKGWDKVVEFLATHGAKLDARDKRGLTPLDAALGKAGGGGFDGSRKDIHESTAALLTKLAAAKQ